MLLEAKSENFYFKVYKLSFMDLELSQQKSYLMLVQAATKVKSITYGQAKLNLSSFVEVRLDTQFVNWF